MREMGILSTSAARRQIQSRYLLPRQSTCLVPCRSWLKRPGARSCRRPFSQSSQYTRDDGKDPRSQELTGLITDEFAHIRESYEAPKHPIVLAHGLLGFAELKLAGSYLPPIHYWHGIKEALRDKGAEVITATVPPSGSIEQRAARLGEEISRHANGKSVNIIAHSMGGLDARYMVSRLQPSNVDVKSLVTVATPHSGSAYADYLIDEIGPHYLPKLYELWERTTGWDTGAFGQLTRRYMTEEFNPKTPDDPNVRYFSYGAMLDKKPPLLSPFRQSFNILSQLEGPNDGLVSVESARWGKYQGTLSGVSHLDLINWTNRLRWTVRKWLGEENPFNAIAFYLAIADMLSQEGL